MDGAEAVSIGVSLGDLPAVAIADIPASARVVVLPYGDEAHEMLHNVRAAHAAVHLVICVDASSPEDLQDAWSLQPDDVALGEEDLAARVVHILAASLEYQSLREQTRVLKKQQVEVGEQLADLREFSEFLEQANDGILITDQHGVIQYANEAAAEIMGREQESMPGQRFFQMLRPTSHGIVERAFRGDNVGDLHGYVDVIVQAGDFGEVVISAAIRRVAKPDGVLISFRDVTEQREIESELRQTKEFLENLIQSSVDAIVAADMRGRIILFNKAAERILGYRARDVVGYIDVEKLYAPDEARDVLARLRADAYGGKGRLELTRKELIARNGERVPVNLTAAIVYESGEEVATVGIFTDLRERVRIEQRLNAAQEKLRLSERQAVAVELAGAAAHELNQPLTSIVGYADMLRRRLSEDDPNHRPASVISQEAQRMAEIVKRIGHITSYQTKPYVGDSKILELSQSEEG